MLLQKIWTGLCMWLSFILFALWWKCPFYAIAINMDWSVYATVIYLVCSVVKMSLFHPPISEHCWKLFCTGGVTRQQAFMHRFEIWRKIIWPTMKKPKYPKPETRVLYFFRLSSLIPLMICSTAVNQGTSPNQSIWSVQISDLSSIVFGVLLLVPTETFCSSQTCPCLADSAFHVLWNCSHNCRYKIPNISVERWTWRQNSKILILELKNQNPNWLWLFCNSCGNRSVLRSCWDATCVDLPSRGAPAPRGDANTR